MKDVWKDIFLVLLLPGMVLFIGVAVYLEKKAANMEQSASATRVKIEQPATQTETEPFPETSVEEDILIQTLPEQSPDASAQEQTVTQDAPEGNDTKTVIQIPVLQLNSLLEDIKAGRVTTPQDQLWTACRTGNEQEVLALLEQGVDPNFQINGFTPLLAASFQDNVTIIKALLKADALVSISASTNNSLAGLTPLMGASLQGYADIVKELLKAGADVNTRARDGRTALMYASYYGHLDVVELLIKNGADVNARAFDRPGTSLTFAAQNGHLEIVKKLLAAGAVDYNNLSLRVAERFEYEDIVKELEAAKQKNSFSI